MSIDVIKHKIIFNNDLEHLPNDVLISTMTIVCKIDTIFNVYNIARYIDLKHTSIISVKHGKSDDPTTNRTLLTKSQTEKNKKKGKKAFYNQVSIQVKTKSGLLNVKLFLNGSIQMTGCKSIESVAEAITTLFDELKTVKAIVNYKSNKIEDKPFVVNIATLKAENVYGFKICMINSNFSIGFEIDRDSLFAILLQDNVKCSFDPIIHACVNIKFEHPEKTISIFVFESGAIIITGARSCNQIIMAYNFINKYLLEHYGEINKNNTLTNSTILEYLNDNINNKSNSICNDNNKVFNSHNNLIDREPDYDLEYTVPENVNIDNDSDEFINNILSGKINKTKTNKSNKTINSKKLSKKSKINMIIEI